MRDGSSAIGWIGFVNWAHHFITVYLPELGGDALGGVFLGFGIAIKLDAVSGRSGGGGRDGRSQAVKSLQVVTSCPKRSERRSVVRSH